MKNKLNEKESQIAHHTSQGITLVSLIITIIILLILAGVGINMALDSDGLFAKANEAVTKWNQSVSEEERIVQNLLEQANEINGGTSEGTKLASGLYDSQDKMIYSWQELLDAGYLTDTNGVLTSGCENNVNPHEEVMAGKLVIDESITEIGDDGLNGLTKLASIVLPENIVLNNYALQNTGITSVGLAGSGASVELPKNMTTIKRGVFYDCKALTKVELGNQIKDIEKNAFAKCSSLEIILSNELNSVGENAFDAVPVVCYSGELATDSWGAGEIHHFETNGICRICKIEYEDPLYTDGRIELSNSNAYLIGYKKGQTEELNIPSTFQIGEYSYTIVGIADNTFQDDWTIKKVTIPNTVTKIGRNVLFDCIGLTEVYVPESVISIGNRFASTDWYTEAKLEKIDINDNNPVYMDIDGVCYSKDGKILIACPHAKDYTNFELPETVEEIRPTAFMNTNLKTITISSKVKKIGWMAFLHCPELTTVNNNASLTEMETALFYRCSKLETITIPEGITKIGSSVFRDCTSLTNVILPNTLEIIDDNAFFSCEALANINIPQKVTSIGGYGFTNTNARVTFSNLSQIATVGDLAFNSCSVENEQIKQQILSLNAKAFDEFYGSGYGTNGTWYHFEL